MKYIKSKLIKTKKQCEKGRLKYPVELIVEFAGIMNEEELDNVIEGTTEAGDIEIRVDYEPEHKQVINKIHDMIDDYNENLKFVFDYS